MRAVFVTSVIVLVVGFFSSVAKARDLPLMGGPGGRPATLRCHGSEHLVGLKAKSGLWIDNIQIECAKIVRSGSVLRQANLELRESTGGRGGVDRPGKTCFGGRPIGSMGVHVFSNKTRVVRDVVFGCVADRDSGGGTLSVGNDTSGNFPPMQACSRGEAAVGIQVRSGDYVDAVSLICEPLQISNSTGPASASASGVGTPGQPGAGSKIIAFARMSLGKCVDRALAVRNQHCPSLPVGQVGDGECTDLVNGAIVSAGFPKINGYVWGNKVGDNTTTNKSLFQPGDIIQLFGASFVGTNGTWATSSQHTAIIEANRGGVLTTLEQNTNLNGENRRFVTEGQIDLNWRLEKGTYVVYRK